ncbi:unnamed protein product [Lymnaea stagnalis]|uniref:Uncharacterized protein n=1 Tax=Lymnaea stagnalis TaxID=6523 RepID=A0AAV2HAR8_LYMST
MVTKFLLIVFVMCLQQRPVSCYREATSVLSCYDGQPGIACTNIGNESCIPIQACPPEEPFCAVRYLTTDDVVKGLDRMCDSYCLPECRESAWFIQCLSCCNQEFLCNKDNAGSGLDHSSSGKFESHAHNPIFVSTYFLFLYVIS